MIIPKKKILLTAVIGFTIISLGYLVIENRPTTDTPPAPVQQAPKPITVEELLRRVNEERAKVGVKPLELNPLLNKSAQMKADEVAQTGVFGHVSPEGKHGYSYISDVGVVCIWQGENAAGAQTAEGAVKDWLGSSAHKAAMLDPRYEQTGFGISDADGFKYVYQHFCDVPNTL